MQLLTEENSSNGCPSDENKLRTRFITSQKLNQLKRSLLESKERIQERTKDKDDDEEESVPEIPSESVH